MMVDFNELYVELNDSLLKYAARLLIQPIDSLDVKDTVNRTWSILSRRINNGNPPEKPTNWLHVVLRNEIKHLNRSNAKEPAWPRYDDSFMWGIGMFSNPELDVEVIADLLEKCSKTFTETELAVLYLYTQEFTWRGDKFGDPGMMEILDLLHWELYQIRSSVKKKLAKLFSLSL